ncbi:hypothetical protein BaRGS_00025192 [Batillaria attramentaria]|uniref:Uncharacterized protein n=1 Tax=Batillaria attramentaria TaxID=370345 RepID=A0ABD0K8X7_9CAEN
MLANGDIKASNYTALTIAGLDRLNKWHLASVARRPLGGLTGPKWSLQSPSRSPSSSAGVSLSFVRTSPQFLGGVRELAFRRW